MPGVFISIGSNIEPDENVRNALRLLRERITVVRISTVYLTEPEGRPDQPPFYNAVVEVNTDIPADQLKWSVLRCIEDQLGRSRSEDKYAPRTIDLDVIVYDDEVVKRDELVIPDPLIPTRAFLAVPLYELAPDFVMPDTGIPLRQIVDCFMRHNMVPLMEYTEEIRKDLSDGL